MFSLYLSFKATGFTPQPAADTAVSSSQQDLFVRSLPAVMLVGSYRSGSGSSPWARLLVPPGALLISFLLLGSCQLSCPQFPCPSAECTELVALEAIWLDFHPVRKHRHALDPILGWDRVLSIFQCKGPSTLL